MFFSMPFSLIQKRHFTLGTAWSLGVAFSPDGTTLASASFDKKPALVGCEHHLLAHTCL
jgi:hypothetical protein